MHVNGKMYVYEMVLYCNSRARDTCYHYRYIEKKKDSDMKRIRSVPLEGILIPKLFILLKMIISSFGIDYILKRISQLTK